MGANQWLSDAVRLQFVSESHLSGRQLIIMNEIATDALKTEPQTSHFDIHPEISKRQYRKTTYEHSQSRAAVDDDTDVFQITLQPMQIRTYVLYL